MRGDQTGSSVAGLQPNQLRQPAPLCSTCSCFLLRHNLLQCQQRRTHLLLFGHRLLRKAQSCRPLWRSGSCDSGSERAESTTDVAEDSRETITLFRAPPFCLQFALAARSVAAVRCRCTESDESIPSLVEARQLKEVTDADDAAPSEVRYAEHPGQADEPHARRPREVVIGEGVAHKDDVGRREMVLAQDALDLAVFRKARVVAEGRIHEVVEAGAGDELSNELLAGTATDEEA